MVVQHVAADFVQRRENLHEGYKWKADGCKRVYNRAMLTKANNVLLMSGATANSMKPICMLQSATELRSHMGEISRPISLSVSPCWKNSSTTRSAHLAQSSYGLKGFEMSEQCKISSRIACLSFSMVSAGISSLAPEQKAAVASPLTSRKSCREIEMK